MKSIYSLNINEKPSNHEIMFFEFGDHSNFLVKTKTNKYYCDFYKLKFITSLWTYQIGFAWVHLLFIRRPFGVRLRFICGPFDWTIGSILSLILVQLVVVVFHLDIILGVKLAGISNFCPLLRLRSLWKKVCSYYGL